MSKSIAQAAAVLASAPVAVKPAKVVQVALRGGPVVTTVAINPKTPYRTAAAHNIAWWSQIQAACAAGPAVLAPLLCTPANPGGVPTHFIGYAVKRGYLIPNPA